MQRLHRISTVTVLLFLFGAGQLRAQSSSCITPSNFKQASFLENQAGLVWTESGSSTSWTVAWGTSGTAADNMTNRVTVSEPWCVLPGIAASAGNNIAYVRSQCGSSHSSWVGPITISGLNPCFSLNRFTAEHDLICGPDISRMTTPNGTDAIWWYAGKPLHYGNALNTDTLRNDRTYWLTPAQENGASQFIGPSIGSQLGNFANFSSGLAITVLDTLVLDSVTLQADGSVQFTVQLWNYQGLQKLNETELLSFDQAGEQRFELNLPLVPGSYQLKLDIQPGGGRLYRSTVDQYFPYRLPGLMSIDSTTNGLPNRYYYLYDLSVNYLCQGSPSSYHIEVGNQGHAGKDSRDTLCLRDTVYNLTQLLLSSPVSQNGYWVDLTTNDTLKYIDVRQFTDGQSLELEFRALGTKGCSDTSSHIVIFQDCGIGSDEHLLSDVTVYPNPTKDVISIASNEHEVDHVEVYNLSGQLLFSGIHPSNTYDLAPYADGIYFIHVASERSSRIFRVQKL